MKLITTALAAMTVAGVCLGAAPAQAQEPGGRDIIQLTCDGQPLTLRVSGGNDGDNWGAAHLVDGGTLIPASLEYLVYDDTAGITLDDEVLSHGQAHQHQQTIVCQDSEQATLGDALPPGMELPPGTATTDQITQTFRVVAVPRP